MSINIIQKKIKFSPIIENCTEARDILGKLTISIDEKKRLLVLARSVHSGLERLDFDYNQVDDPGAVIFKTEIIERSVAYDKKIDQGLANSGMRKPMLGNAENYFIQVSSILEEMLS